MHQDTKSARLIVGCKRTFSQRNHFYYYFLDLYLVLLSFILKFEIGEAGLFEEAITKYGKDFSDIQKDFVSFIALLHSVIA